MTRARAGIDILISTHNGARTLPAMLEACAALNTPRRRWRLIVVDNASTDDTAQILNAAAASLPILPLHCAKPGKLPALKLARTYVEADLVVFTDDDILPAPGWLQDLEAAADAHPECGLFGGPIVPTPIDPVSGWFGVSTEHHSELYAASNQPDGPVDAEAHIFGPNFMMRSEHLGVLDVLSADLGPTFEGKRARAFAMGEDTEIMRLLQYDDVQARYVASASVGHMVRGFQTELTFMLDRAERHGRGFAIRALKSARNSTLRRLRLVVEQYSSEQSLRMKGEIAAFEPEQQLFNQLWQARWASGAWREALFRSNLRAQGPRKLSKVSVAEREDLKEKGVER